MPTFASQGVPEAEEKELEMGEKKFPHPVKEINTPAQEVQKTPQGEDAEKPAPRLIFCETYSRVRDREGAFSLFFSFSFPFFSFFVFSFFFLLF